MINRHAAAIVLLLTGHVWASGASSSQSHLHEPPVQPVLSHLVNDIVMPAHANWQQASRLLAETATQFCAGQADIQSVRARWLAAQHAWIALQPSMAAPVAQQLTGLQVQFWPDKRNLAERQVEELVAQQTPITPESLLTASVAVRGLSASEYLLFDAKRHLAADAERERYCPLLQANTAYQAALALNVSLQMHQQSFVDSMLKTPNGHYADANGPLAVLLRANVVALDVMKKKLGTAIGQPGDTLPQWYQAEAWRSGDTLASLEAGIAGSYALWHDNGLRTLIDGRYPTVAQQVDLAYQQVQSQLLVVHGPMEKTMASDQGKQDLATLYNTLNTLHLLYEKELARVLGITLGFNGTDGD